MVEETNQQRRIDRRQFLGIAWAASTVALLVQGLVGIFSFLKPRSKSGGFGGVVLAGLVEEFPAGSVRHIPSGQFFISHLEGKGLLAIWHRCTHLGCTVPWREDQGQFNCPCHSSLFSVNGEVIDGPAPRPLDLFPIEVVDGEVKVDTGKVIRRQQFEDSQAEEV
jgi:cytochrome b6-f complex iron-sulfur subunit